MASLQVFLFCAVVATLLVHVQSAIVVPTPGTPCMSACADPSSPDCQTCCRTVRHEINWHCSDAGQEAKCCKEWTADCWNVMSADNFNHACDMCFPTLGNICQCSNGNATAPNMCPMNGLNDCASCNAGYYLTAPDTFGRRSCMKIPTCTCPNGTPVMFNPDATVNAVVKCDFDAMNCASCNAGYMLNFVPTASIQSCIPIPVCTCPNGMPTVNNGKPATIANAGLYCEMNGAIDCSSCMAGYRLSAAAGTGAQTCLKNPVCTCPNGMPTMNNGVDVADLTMLCEMDGAVDCSSCAAGYHLSAAAPATGAQTCVVNMCTCAGGTAAVGTKTGLMLCETETEDCSACNAGYRMVGAGAVRTCAENICSCPSGTATMGSGSGPTFCDMDGAVDCLACNTGYHLDGAPQLGNQRCVVDAICTCPGGTPAANGNVASFDGPTGLLCEANGNVDCSACNPGYMISEPAGVGAQTCIANLCWCPNGTPTVADGTGTTLCDHNFATDCSACDGGFTLVNLGGSSVCQANVCTCVNGMPAMTATPACSANAAAICSSCFPGYTLNGPNCVLNVCTCPNGAAALGMGTGMTLCEANGVDCSSCMAGYTMTGTGPAYTCTANVCTCPNGTPTVASGAASTLCEMNGAMDCSACKAGYRMVNNGRYQVCVANVCSCPNGTPAVASGTTDSTLCEMDDSVDCSFCATGYHLESAGPVTSTCAANMCSCPNGTPTMATGSVDTLCEADKTVDCTSCMVGYTLSAAPAVGLQTCVEASCAAVPAAQVNGSPYTASCAGAVTPVGGSCIFSCSATGYSGFVKQMCSFGTFKGADLVCVANSVAPEIASLPKVAVASSLVHVAVGGTKNDFMLNQAKFVTELADLLQVPAKNVVVAKVSNPPLIITSQVTPVLPQTTVELNKDVSAKAAANSFLLPSFQVVAVLPADVQLNSASGTGVNVVLLALAAFVALVANMAL